MSCASFAPLDAPSPAAGPSKIASTSFATQSPYCKLCFGGTGRKYALEYTDNNLLACPKCYLVDETATHGRNTVSLSEKFGAQIDQNDLIKTFDRDWAEFGTGLEKTFKDAIDGLFYTYLIDPETSLLRYSAPSLVKGAKMWYLEIRKMEKHRFRRKSATINASARRVTYQICVAVKLALQENSAKVLKKRLGKSSDSIIGFTKADERIAMERTQTLGPGHPGYLDSLHYLTKMYRRYSMVLDSAISSLDLCLILVMQCVGQLKLLVNMPHEQRIKHLVTKPVQSKKKREWVDADWAWLRQVKWDDVLLVAHNLYLAQQCVCLWGSKCKPPAAVALTIWACMAVVGESMPQSTNISSELAASCFKLRHWTAAERAVEMKNWLIAWSTSIPDAKLPFPKMIGPERGGLGNGFTMYRSDSRRRIPEAEMAATAARTIAENWRTILHTRLSTRSDALPLDDEHNMARVMFARAGPRMRREKDDNILLAPQPSVPPPYGHVSLIPRYTTQAEDRLHYMSGAPPLHPTTTALATPPPEQTIEDMLAIRDDSSEEGDCSRNDHAWRLNSTGLGLSDVSQESGPFGFSIGPQGFSINKSFTPAKIVISQTAQISRSSSSAASMSPAPTSSRWSNASAPPESGDNSALETERIIPGFSRDYAQPQYWKTIKREANRRSASRSTTPRSMASPLSAHANLVMSPTPSIDEPLRELPSNLDEEGGHIGQLVREREQFLTYSQDRYRADGRLVSEVVEIAMNEWVEGEKRNGTIPHVISNPYLTGLGVDGDPREIDLGPYVESQRRKMSPVEALLRIGIRPTDIPPHYVVHSLIHLDQLLNQYHSHNALAPLGQELNGDQLDAELKLLFKNGDEKLDDILMSQTEIAARKRQILAAGIWEDVDASPGRRHWWTRSKDELQQIADAFEAESEGEDAIQEAMLSSWWSTEDGLPRLDAFSYDGDADLERSRKAPRKGYAVKQDSGEKVRQKPVRRRKKGEEEDEASDESESMAVATKRRKQIALVDSPGSAFPQMNLGGLDDLEEK